MNKKNIILKDKKGNTLSPLVYNIPYEEIKAIREDDNADLVIYTSDSHPNNTIGSIYYNTKLKTLFFYNGEDWIEIMIENKEKKTQDKPADHLVAEYVTHNTIIVEIKNNSEYRYQEGVWQDSPVFQGLHPNTEYIFEYRHKESNEFQHSEPSPPTKIKTKKIKSNPPKNISITNITKKSAIVDAGNNSIISIDSHNWFDSPHEFTNLQTNKKYTVLAKTKETDTHYESSNYTEKSFKTLDYIYGFEIDESNKNPETAVRYIEDAVGKKPAVGGSRDAKLNDWEDFVKQLSSAVLMKDNQINYRLKFGDLRMTEDEEESNLTGKDGDVMVEFKHIWVKEEYSNNIKRIYLSLSPFKEYTWTTKDIKNGNGYIHFLQDLVLKYLFILIFKSRDYNTALGRGRYNNTKSSNGIANHVSYFFGETSYASQRIKFFGLEDYWGRYQLLLDGVIYDKNKQQILMSLDPNNTPVNSYDNIIADNLSTINGYYQYTNRSPGFIGIDTNASNSQSYTSIFNNSSGSGLTSIVTGHGYLDNIANGLFSYLTKDRSSDSGISTRIAYNTNNYFYIGVYYLSYTNSIPRSISGVVASDVSFNDLRNN